MRSQQEVTGMLCPVCKVPLAMSDRQGIEIDYCPNCRGIWLDRGELDKIIERSGAGEPPAAPIPPAPPTGYPPQPQAPWGGHGGRYDKYGRPKRRKSFLEELFD